MKKLALILALTAAMPAHAGGPVIEDTAEAAAPRDRNAVPLVIIGALIVAGLLAGGGSDNCVSPEDTPAPTPEQPGGGC